MVRLISCLLLLLVVLGGNAQYHFIKQWDYRYGGNDAEDFKYMAMDADGGFVIAGISWSAAAGGDKSQPNQGASDIWIIKVDSAGNRQWDRRFGSLGHDAVFDISTTTDGGYLIGGHNAEGIGGDKTEARRGSYDYWVVKIDAYGNKLWDKTFGGTGLDYFCDLTQANDGGYLICGVSTSSASGDKSQNNWSAGLEDFWVVKIDSLGNKQWDKRYGGVGYDFFNSVITLEDGGYLLGGSSRSDSSGDKSQNSRSNNVDYWIIKIDSVGNRLWDKRYGTSGSDLLYRIGYNRNNQFVLVGNSYEGIDGDKTENTKGHEDIWMIGVDSNGSQLWDKDLGGSEKETPFFFSVTKDGGYLISGSSYSSSNGDKSETAQYGKVWVVKTDSVGNKQWDKTIFQSFSSVYYGQIIQSKDGCYVMASDVVGKASGYTSQDSRDTLGDYWILKFCMEPFNSIEQRTGNQEPSQIQVWPNPFSSYVSIALTASHVSTATFTITNTTGQVVYQQQETNLATGYTKMLDLNYLPNGVYFVEVITAEGKAVQRLVKE